MAKAGTSFQVSSRTLVAQIFPCPFSVSLNAKFSSQQAQINKEALEDKIAQAKKNKVSSSP